MVRNLIFWLLMLLSTLVAVARPGGGGVGPHAPAPVVVQTASLASSNLQAALGYIPAGTQYVAYTDWARIKQDEGAEAINSTRPLDERIDFLLSTGQTQAAASGFALPYAKLQAEQWGWDSTDLVWEATLSSDGPPVFVLRLRDDFDFDALISLFEARDYTSTEDGDAIQFSHPLDLTAEWRTELAVFNAAVIPDEKILIHSSSPDAIASLVAMRKQGTSSWGDLPATQAMATALGETSAAMMTLGPKACTDLGMEGLVGNLLNNKSISTDQIEALRKELFGAQKLHPYLGLGIGYRSVDGQPLGTIVMEYAAPADAEADLAPRRALLETGTSAFTHQPYSTSLLTAVDAAVVDRAIVLQVEPNGGRPQRLFEMFNRRDMTFAACP